jgi:hypothetical protein
MLLLVSTNGIQLKPVVLPASTAMHVVGLYVLHFASTVNLENLDLQWTTAQRESSTVYFLVLFVLQPVLMDVTIV